ncbi:MAG: hypothetical protein ACOY5B_18775 [Spirochaetota bacterium]
MSLHSAHQGYEYQDLLTAFFILREMLAMNDSEFYIDQKQTAEDRFDDLTIIKTEGIFKKQIKYGAPGASRDLCKSDLSNDSVEMAIDKLFQSWKSYDDTSPVEMRLCLAWAGPNDDLLPYLTKFSDQIPSFDSHPTCIFKINLEKVWHKINGVDSSWRRLRRKQSFFDREEFAEFCNNLIIEIDFPKFSGDFENPGELEQITLDLLKRIGIGVYPNANLSTTQVALSLLHRIKQGRSTESQKLNVKNILHYLRISTDLGAIPQDIPIDHALNILTDTDSNGLLTNLLSEKKVILLGEPGAGKSWFIKHFEEYLHTKSIACIKHYCYTDMQDNLRQSRISVDTLCGNLISGILNGFPDLRSKKHVAYGSNLLELNNLIQHVPEQLVIIIDGLDHIQRIRESSGNQMPTVDSNIIGAISSLELSSNVCLLLATQKTVELEILLGFQNFRIPKWDIVAIRKYLEKANLADLQLEREVTLSGVILEKSQGNALYVSYLIRELRRLHPITSKALETLPPHDEHLVQYYEYMLRRLGHETQIPLILSGVSFGLTESELAEITGLGDIVGGSLEILYPVLKQNETAGGFSIYHESFRRFLINKIKARNIEITVACLKPVTDWLLRKDFYSDAKAHRYLLSLLLERNQLDAGRDILSEKEFLSLSLLNGHPWQVIKQNVRLLLQFAILNQNYPQLVRLIQQLHTLESTEHEFEEAYGLFLTAVGNLKGFEYVRSFLVFDGGPAIEERSGLEACYLCEQNNIAAPWHLYINHFKKNENIAIEDFKYYVKYLILKKKYNKLLDIREQIEKGKLREYESIFMAEILAIADFPDSDLTSEQYTKLTSVFKYDKENAEFDLTSFTSRVSKIQHIGEDETAEFELFFQEIKRLSEEGNFASVAHALNSFRGKNWFYNWIVYYSEIINISIQEPDNYFEIRKTFNLLIQDLQVFKGEIRVSDLYQMRHLINESISKGLSLLTTPEQWSQTIDLLLKVHDETAITLGNDAGTDAGPLPTETLIHILCSYATNENSALIVKVVEGLVTRSEERGYFSSIANLWFVLSSLQSRSGLREKAQESLLRALRFKLAYTFRKDRTLDELLSAIQSVAKIDRQYGVEYVKRIASLANSVVNHTDGRSTSRFTVEWFEEFARIKRDEAGKYLAEQLLTSSYDWRLEESFHELLLIANGEVSPELEFALLQTCPLNNSEAFVRYGLMLLRTDPIRESIHAQKFSHHAINRFLRGKHNEFSQDTKDQASQLFAQLNIVPCAILDDSIIEENGNPSRFSKNRMAQIADSENRNNLQDMKPAELADFFSDHPLSDSHLLSLQYLFSERTKLDSDTKSLLIGITKRDSSDEAALLESFDLLFNENSEISVFYWVCRFCFGRGNWVQRFVNKRALAIAHQQDSELCMKYLAELLKHEFSQDAYVITSMFASNLINAFASIGYNTTIIKEMWGELFDSISSRLPVQEEIGSIASVEQLENFSEVEIFACILFTRLRNSTTERHNQALSGLYMHIKNNAPLMLRPIGWFLKNRKYFLEISQICIVELICDVCESDEILRTGTESELKAIYPTGIFNIDFRIEALLGLSHDSLVLEELNVTYPIDNEGYHFHLVLNRRHYRLENIGFSLRNIFGEFWTKNKQENQERSKLFWNHSFQMSARNLLVPNYLVRLINTRLYNDFRQSIIPIEDTYTSVYIEYPLLISQWNSRESRPMELIGPKDFAALTDKNLSFSTSGEWIRIASFEEQTYREDYGKKVERYSLFTCINLNSDSTERPYIDTHVSPFEFETWMNSTAPKMDSHVITRLFHDMDTFEAFRILWINPGIFAALNLRLGSFENGLYAVDASDTKVLKYRSWVTGYVGNENVYDEIPKLMGADLLMRSDAFAKMISFFNRQPSLFTNLTTDSLH